MRGLLAVECMYHQIVAGNKGQTRRSGGLEMINDNLEDGWDISEWVTIKNTAGKEIPAVEFMIPDYRGKVIQCAPRYKVGEVMYLKEPIFIYDDGHIIYKFDNINQFPLNRPWNNKLYMPAASARAFIKITGIRCEHLLDISDEDCLAEGIEFKKMNVMGYKYYGTNNWVDNPKESFLSLYRFANKVKEVPNIFVWVYEFEYLKDYKI